MSGRPRLTAAELEDWSDSGASWRLIAIHDQRVTVELRACTGEAVDLRDGEGPELLAYVRSHADDAP